jgi:hypothetical protein
MIGKHPEASRRKMKHDETSRNTAKDRETSRSIMKRAWRARCVKLANFTGRPYSPCGLNGKSEAEDAPGVGRCTAEILIDEPGRRRRRSISFWGVGILLVGLGEPSTAAERSASKWPPTAPMRSNIHRRAFVILSVPTLHR